MQPIIRDIALQTRSRNVELVDRLIIEGIVDTTPDQAIGNSDGDDIVEAGETFELDLRVTNGTAISITNVSVGQNPAATGTAGATTQGVSGDTFPTIGSGQSAITTDGTDINVIVPGGVPDNSTIFITFDATVAGVTRRLTVGPILVNSTRSGAVFRAN
jgi:hypothetical protein